PPRATRDLHSFPTRRSSDLYPVGPQASGFDAAALEREASANHDVIINAFRVQGDSAVVHAMTPTNTYRQTLFYRRTAAGWQAARSEEHTSELQSRENLVCRL